MPHARALPPPPAGPWVWAWAWRGVAGEQTDGTRVVLSLNPYNYSSYSLLCWRRLHCESFRLLHPSPSFCVRTPSPSPNLLLSLFASPPRAYIPSSFVSSPCPGSCAHWNWESRASGTPAVFEFTCSGEGRQSHFWGVSLAARRLATSTSSSSQRTLKALR